MGDESQALSLQWVYGVSNLAANIVDLSDEHNDCVCYVAAHTAVIYDKRTRKQTFLQGHCSAITAIAASEDRSLLITADAAVTGSMLVFWDPASGQPIRTLQQPHAAGVVAIAVAPDASQMATLSAVASSSGVQEIALWDLRPLSSSSSGAAMQPVATTPIPTGDIQMRLCYNPDDPLELLSNGSRRAYFWRSQLPGSALLSYYSPPLRAADFHQEVGDFVASVFVPGSTQALTSTADGDVVVWAEQGMSAQMGTRATDRRAIKVMRLHGAAINHLSCIGKFVVTGGADGLVRLFDSLLKLSAWFEQLEAGPVTCVSFATKGQPRPAAEMQLHRLACPSFMVSTSSGKIVAVASDSFNSTDPDNPSGSELLVESPASCITDVAAHPLRPELLLLDAEQKQLLRWDLPGRCCVLSKRLSSEYAAVRMLLARDASILVLGCAGGQVVLLRGDSLEELVVLSNTRHAISSLSISSSGQYVAAADEAGTVILYGFLPSARQQALLKWDLVGKFKAHHGQVVGLHFGEAPSGQTRLFSLGADKRLLEYDLAAALAAGAGLRAVAVLDVVAPGGSGSPCSMCFAPPMPYYSHNSMDMLLLFADDAYKVKAFNPDTRTACATYLGPTFGGSINKLLPFRSVTDNGAWLAYSTAQQVVGLIAWPLDGDPKHSMGVIAHPGDVRDIALSFDGRKLITLDSQGILNIWDINTAALGQVCEQQFASDATGGSSWTHLIGDPALLEELRNYFCYAQVIGQQQSELTGAYEISDRVPVSMLPDLMRAAGFYPSAADTANLLAHVMFLAGMAPEPDDTATSSSHGAAGAVLPASSSHAEHVGQEQQQQQQQSTKPLKQQRRQLSGKSWELDGGPEGVDFDTFLCLFVNHRPVASISQQQIEEAFTALTAPTAAGVMSSQQFLELLQQGGEAMSAAELQHILQVLMGTGSQPEDCMPEHLDAQAFTAEILGLEG